MHYAVRATLVLDSEPSERSPCQNWRLEEVLGKNGYQGSGDCVRYSLGKGTRRGQFFLGNADGVDGAIRVGVVASQGHARVASGGDLTHDCEEFLETSIEFCFFLREWWEKCPFCCGFRLPVVRRRTRMTLGGMCLRSSGFRQCVSTTPQMTCFRGAKVCI